MQLGFHLFTPKDFHAIFHFWRVIGYCLGIEDEYNLCEGPDEEVVEYCRYIYYQGWLPVIQANNNPVGVQMMKGIATAMSTTSTILNYNVIMKYANQFMQLNQDFQLNGFREQFKYACLKMTIKHLFKYQWANRMSVLVSDWKYERAVKKRENIENDLKQEYADFKLENTICPHNIQFAYSNQVRRPKQIQCPHQKNNTERAVVTKNVVQP